MKGFVINNTFYGEIVYPNGTTLFFDHIQKYPKIYDICTDCPVLMFSFKQYTNFTKEYISENVIFNEKLRYQMKNNKNSPSHMYCDLFIWVYKLIISFMRITLLRIYLWV